MATQLPPPLDPTTQEPVERQSAHTPLPRTEFPDLEKENAEGSKSRWWVWLIIFALIGYGCYRLYRYENGKKAAGAAMRQHMEKPREVSVVTGSAHRGDVPVYLEGLGTVTAFNTVTVKPRVDGQLTSVRFSEGQVVKEGQILATLDTRPFQVALDQAKGTLAQARGNLARDEAALRDAEVNYQRNQALFNEKIIAKQQLDTQRSTADQARGAIQADKAVIQAAQSSIDSAQLNLQYTNITAPISGRIGLRLVDSGNIVHMSDTTGLAVITQLQPISVIFNIPEDQLPPVLAKLRQGAKLKTEAFDRTAKTKLADGTLLTVDNQIDQTTGTSKLKAVFANNDSALFPNQFVNVRLSLDTQKNSLIVPAAAIQRGPTGTFVYLVREDNTVTVRDVKTGLFEGNDATIVDGLAAGDRMVIDGAEKLTEGMKISDRPPAARNSSKQPKSDLLQ